MVRSRDARWFHKLALAGVAVGVMACADRSNPLGIAPSFDRHGSGHGSEHSGHPWTGRSGSAAITAYALFGTAGYTNLTVTSYRRTDSLFTTPAGCIDKIQVKVYNAQGRHVSTQNFNLHDHHDHDAGSSVSVRVRGAQVGYRLALHVNVSCIDRHRTDVVEADVDVIAPNTTDPAVIRLKVPGTPLTSAPVTISAYVKVTRGLAAASGNCVLYVNGSPMGALGTVTIAAGDSVPCTFTRSFPTEGTVQVTVAFENVSPTDLNPANNSATTDMPVYVVPPTLSLIWDTAMVYDDTVTYHNWTVQSNRLLANESDLLDLTPALLPGFTLQQTIDSLYPLIDTARSSSDTIGNAQHAQFVGIINTQVKFPLTSLTVSQVSGATTYHSQAWTNVARSGSSGAGADCQDLLSGAVSLVLCAYGPTSTFPNGWTKITYSRDMSSVTASEIEYRVDYRNSSDEPLASCNTASTSDTTQCYTITTLPGPRLVHFGATYTFNVVLQDPTHRFSATVRTNITRSVLSHTETDPPTYTANWDNGLESFLRYFFWESVVNDRIRYSGLVPYLTTLTQTVGP